MPRGRECGPGDRSPECIDPGSFGGLPAGQQGSPGESEASTGRCPGGQRRDPVTGGCYEPSTPQKVLNCDPATEHPVYSAQYPDGACLPNDGSTTGSTSTATTGGGGGGGSVATAPPLPAYQPAQMGGPAYNLLLNGIQSIYSGNVAPYDENTLNTIKGKLFQASTGRADAAKQALGQDLVRRGLSRSGVAVEQTGAINRAAATDYTSNYRDTLIKAAEENFKAKVTALQEARQLVAIQAQYDIANARNSTDRDIAMQNATLGYARINADYRELQAKLASAYQLAQMGNEAALEQLLISMGVKTGGTA